MSPAKRHPSFPGNFLYHAMEMKLPAVFRIAFLAVMFFCTLVGKLVAADLDHEDYKLVDLGGMKIVIFEDTKSRDGHYALGWTILPVDKKAPAVDWSRWDSDNPASMNKYEMRDEEHPQARYEGVDCVVDLRQKFFLHLPAAFPDYPHKNRGYFVASWGPEIKGVRHAFVQIDARFYTTDLWLVTLGPDGMKQKQIVEALNKQVLTVLRDKRPVDFDQYGITFPVSSTAAGGAGKVTYHSQTADVPFYAEIPKSMVQSSMVAGTVTVDLKNGGVGKAESDTQRDDPYARDPALKKADAELNKTYVALLHILTAASAETLKKEQRKWIQQRNYNADEAREEAIDASHIDATAESSKARDKSLLESTLKRTAELKVRLAGAAKN